MHRWGHVGASLLTYAPIGGGLVAAGRDRLAVVGALAAVAGATLPDADEHLPGVEHRGPTHTLWFAFAVGAVAGALVRTLTGWIGPSRARRQDRTGLAVLTALVAVVTTATHVAADAVTPMGIRPFAPLRNRSITFDVVRSRDRRANRVLLVLGALASVGAGALGRVLRSRSERRV